MSIPPYSFTLKKNNVLNDVAPNVAFDPNRLFIVPVVETSGEFISNVRIIGRFVDAQNKETDGTFNATLYTQAFDGTWSACGVTYETIQSGATVSLPIGGLTYAKTSYVKIDGISTASGVKMVFNYHLDETDIVQRTCEGYPIVSAIATLDPALQALVQDIDNQVTDINNKTPALGTNVMAGSSPVTIATDDTVMTGITTYVKNTADVLVGSSANVDATAPVMAVQVGGQATSGLPTDAGANGDLKPAWMTRLGATVVAAYNAAKTGADALQTGVKTLGTDVTGYLNVLSSAFYNVTPTSRTDGQAGPLQADVKGSLKTAPSDVAGAALFPTVNAQTDGLTAGSTTQITSLTGVLNGSSTWDRARGSLANVTANVLSTFQGVISAAPMARYAATPPTLTDGQGTPLACDIQGNSKSTLGTLIAGEDLTNNVLATVLQPLATNTHAMSTYFPSQPLAVAGYVVKASAGTFYFVYGTNSSASTRYIQLFNQATSPASGTLMTALTTCFANFPVPAGQSFSLDLTPYGLYCATGIVVASSTAVASKTDSGVADTYITVGYL